MQLTLAIRAHECPTGPTMSELAQSLLLRHNSVVGLVDRAERAGLVCRQRDGANASRVHVVLTDEGSSRLDRLSRLHLEWLAANGDSLASALRAFA